MKWHIKYLIVGIPAVIIRILVNVKFHSNWIGTLTTAILVIAFVKFWWK